MMTSFNAESKEFVLGEDLFIEASAGTGKSYTLQTLLLRLLIEKEMRIEQILLVTFTRLATRELKGRIRTALKKTLDNVRTKGAVPEYLEKYIEDTRGAKKVERLLKGALSSMDQAKIMTIHGFSAYLLNQYGEFEGSAAEDSLASNEQLMRLVKDFFRAGLPNEVCSLWQQELLLEHYRGDFNALVMSLGKLAIKRIPIFSGMEVEELLKELEEIRREISAVDLVEKLTSESVHYKGLHTKEKKLKKEAAEEFQKLASWVKGEAVELRFKEIFKLLPENKQQKVPSVEPLYSRLFELLQKLNDPLVIFALIAEKVRLYITAVLEKESLLFYDDLLLKASVLVERPEVQKGIKEEFRALFIDEFQDTDRLQWKIFSTLFFKKMLVIVVGDPKQSIYRFRQADLYTYMKVKESFSCHLSLSINYRSAPRLVHALNELCTPIEDFLLLPERGESFACPPIFPKESAEKEEGHCEIWSVQNEEELFLWVAQELFALQQKGIKLSDCAILVKDRFQMSRLKEAFKGFSLPLETVHEAPITQSAAYLLLLDLLAALLKPSDLSSNAKVLLSPLFSLSLDEIEEKQITLLPLFFTWSQVLHENGILAAIKAIIKHSGSHLVQQKEGVRIYSDLLQLAEIGEESGCRAMEWLRFFRTLPQLKEGDDRLKPRVLLEKEAPLAMTIHMSKGLEFEVLFPIGVIAPFHPKRELVYSSQLQGYHIGNGEVEMDAEKMRLFYVAITRAKKRLYLPYIEEDVKKIDGKSSTAAFFMSKRLQKPIREIPIYTFVNQKIPSFSLSQQTPLLMVDRSLSIPALPRESITSFSSLFPHPFQEKKRSEETIPLGLEVGILLHLLLEKISFRHASEEALLQVIRPYLHHSLLESFAEQVAKLLFQLMHLPLQNGFTLADLDEKMMRKEVHFTTIKKGGSVKGVIDLFFSHQGKYYFLDWKSNYLESFTEETLAEEMRLCHYHEQAAIYKRAVKEYLALFDDRPFEEIFGGYYYLFIRGAKSTYGR